VREERKAACLPVRATPPLMTPEARSIMNGFDGVGARPRRRGRKEHYARVVYQGTLRVPQIEGGHAYTHTREWRMQLQGGRKCCGTS
jgi:hypothetical protein